MGLFLAFLGLSGTNSVLGQASGELRVATHSSWVVTTDAGDRLIDGPRPVDAEMLVTARFRYEGPEPVTPLRIELAIPDGSLYVAGSALGPGAMIHYSLDGGRTFGAAADLMLPVKPDDPSSASHPADPANYTHIRWEVQGTHFPGVSGLVSFRVRPAGGTGGDASPDPVHDQEAP